MRQRILGCSLTPPPSSSTPDKTTATFRAQLAYRLPVLGPYQTTRPRLTLSQLPSSNTESMDTICATISSQLPALGRYQTTRPQDYSKQDSTNGRIQPRDLASSLYEPLQLFFPAASPQTEPTTPIRVPLSLPPPSSANFASPSSSPMATIHENEETYPFAV